MAIATVVFVVVVVIGVIALLGYILWDTLRERH